MARNRKGSLDWVLIKYQYRTGQLSVAEISRRHGCAKTTIIRMAEREGWERDLDEAVRTATRTQLVESRVQKEVEENQRGKMDDMGVEERDALSIQVAAASNVQILERHLSTISRGRGLVDKLMMELEMGTNNKDLVLELIEAETEDDRSDRRRGILTRLTSLRSRASTMRDLSTAASKLIAVERQALNLDGDRTEEDGFAQFYAAVKAKPGQRLSTMIAARIGDGEDEG